MFISYQQTRSTKNVLVFFYLLILPGLCFGSAIFPLVSKENDSLARAYIHLSSIDQSFQPVIDNYVASLKTEFSEFNDGFWSRFQSELRISELVNNAVIVVNNHFSKEELISLVGFYNSQTGMKYTGVQSEAAVGQKSMEWAISQFTDQEKKEIGAFINSPAGQKLNAELMSLQQDFGSVFDQWRQDKLAIFNKMAAESTEEDLTERAKIMKQDSDSTSIDIRKELMKESLEGSTK